MLAISYITAHFLFASAKHLFTQNCKAPSGVEIFDGFSQSELKQDADLARRDLAKDAKIARRRAYAFDSLRLYYSSHEILSHRHLSFLLNIDVIMRVFSLMLSLQAVTMLIAPTVARPPTIMTHQGLSLLFSGFFKNISPPRNITESLFVEHRRMRPSVINLYLPFFEKLFIRLTKSIL